MRAAEQRFTDRVANYVKFRPGYPDAVLDLLKRITGLSADSIVADIGSGTGISSEFLLRSGCTLYAVEPNREMRTAAEQHLAGHPRFHSVDGSAKATTLADHSVDLICAAQAFHWFQGEETSAEFKRILKPGGWVALIWNVRLLDTSPFLRGYEALLLQFGTDYQVVRHENIGDTELGAVFGDGGFERHSFPSSQVFDFEGLKGRLLSSSYAPPPGHPQHDAMLEELRRLFEATGQEGKVSFDYETQVFLGQL